jgi:nucleotide-binding universal stress UspA family protein
MARIETILLATDASAASGAAEGQAIELAARLAARLVVLSVVTGPSAQRETRQLAVERIVQRARREGADASGLTWAGDPGESIVEAAEAEGADLIVVGTHERGAVGRLFLGSVSDYVVRHARCPVLVVRPTRVAAPSGVA